MSKKDNGKPADQRGKASVPNELLLRMYPPGKAPAHLTTQQQSGGTIKKESLVKPAPVQQSTTGPIKWPESLHSYVERCFAACNSEESKNEMQSDLSKIINEAVATGILYSRKWEVEPIPLLSKQPGKLNKQMELKDVKVPLKSLPVKKTATANAKNYPLAPALSNATPSSGAKLPSTDSKITGEQQKKQERAQRFQREFESHMKLKQPSQSSASSPRSISSADDSFHPTRGQFIVGSCEILEKSYLRLTAPPEPYTVRPLRVLKKTLELLKGKWKQAGDYGYICDQFKSLRQDLTVQGIQNDFTIEVYEIHARIALEKSDLGEYNQCQTQLKALYSHAGAKQDCAAEFLAYRILYYLLTKNKTGLVVLLSQLKPKESMSPAVNHALRVREALAFANYPTFFALYLEAPNMGGYLMDHFIERERAKFIANVCIAYRPSLSVSFLAELMKFQSLGEFLDYLHECNAAFIDKEETLIDTKQSLAVFEQKLEQYKTIDIKGQL